MDRRGLFFYLKTDQYSYVDRVFLNMANRFISVFVVFSLISFCFSTVVRKCNQGSDESNSRIHNQVFISGCDEPPCKLPKNTTINFDINFTPSYDVARLKTRVYGWLLLLPDIPIPYFELDDVTACNNLYLKSSGARASCPVRKGQQYVYKTKIMMKDSYPKVKVTLHWAFVDEKNNADVFCFELPVKITSSRQNT
ncbi:hypothetical protein PGB90_004641 [Kerria lacca]